MDKQYYVGIDIGSTASKVVVLDDEKLVNSFCIPTGWNSKETAKNILQRLQDDGLSENMNCAATGYGRICVDYADKVITEITCHAKGAYALFGVDGTVIDIGGQDTKIISLENGMVRDFLMNDKCAAGTGKFIEVMANRLGTDFEELYALAFIGDSLSISSMCTVFAESEVISYIGSGEKRENIITSFDKNMKKISSLGGLAPGEKIYSTRFMQGKAYMVTFKDVDPLFVIDTKNPKSMKVLGYLKIPGYSNYLHPFKSGYLIGFDGNTVNNGYKISLFDVRDFANPKEVDVLNIGAKGSYSYIDSDHKALMFDNKRDIFAIPVYATRVTKKVYEGKEYDDIVGQFDGAFVIKVSEKGFNTKGKITHYTNKQLADMQDNYYYDYNKNIQRCVQIGDNIYTLSQGMVKVNNINSLKEIKSLKLD